MVFICEAKNRTFEHTILFASFSEPVFHLPLPCPMPIIMAGQRGHKNRIVIFNLNSIYVFHSHFLKKKLLPKQKKEKEKEQRFSLILCCFCVSWWPLVICQSMSLYRLCSTIGIALHIPLFSQMVEKKIQPYKLRYNQFGYRNRVGLSVVFLNFHNGLTAVQICILLKVMKLKMYLKIGYF